MESKKSKTSMLARCRGPFSRVNPPSGARRDSDFSCRSRTPGNVCSSGVSIAGPAGHASMKMLVDGLLRSIYTHSNINIQQSGNTTFSGVPIMFGQTPVKPQSTSFHPECLAYGAWAALLKITEQENQRSGLAVVMRPSGESTHRIPVKCAKRELGRGSPTATTHITVALTLFPCQACQVQSPTNSPFIT